MKSTLKTIFICVLVAAVSAGATYGTYNYCLDQDGKSSFSDVSEHAKSFNQKNFHLASLTDAGYPDFTKVAEHAVNAVVQVTSTVTVSTRHQAPMDLFDFFDFGFGNGNRGGNSVPQERTQQGLGSGVIISADGYIVTNNHVIDKANKIELLLNNGEKYTAKLIGADPNTDIALLKVDASDLEYLSFGNSDDLKVGEWVLAIGNPMGLTSTVTAGIVSAKGRGGISNGNRMAIESFIQTDAAINSGNSGGALVNADGQLVGINTAIYSRTGDFAGYGFAVPITIAAKVVADLKEYGTVQRALLGVSIYNLSAAKELTPEMIESAKAKDPEFDLDTDKIKDIKLKDGVLVGGFSEQSAAKQAGLQKYDVITSINGVKVKNSNELMLQVSRFRPGDKISVAVNRLGAEKTYEITLKNDSGTTSVVKKEDGISKVGASFKDLSDDKKKEYGISYGVEVAKVSTDGKFYEKGIRSGFIILEINGRKVSSVKDVESIIQQAQSGEKELIIKGLNSSGNKRLYAVELFDE